MQTLYGDEITYLIQDRSLWGGMYGGVPAHYRYLLLDTEKVDTGISMQFTACEAHKFAKINGLEILKHTD